jgi:2-polyprenyl-6-methoxyphenol hydroxylase-like FAD-dependent oxidoreductase
MKAITCGEGVASWTLAWRLDCNDWQVLLVERAPGPRTGGYMIDFFGSGYDVAEMVGLLPELRRGQTTVDAWSRGRVILVGDACHAISLMAGQGASMAFGGATALLWAAMAPLRASVVPADRRPPATTA